MGKGLLERLGLVRKPPLTLEEFREQVIGEVLRRKPELEVERVDHAEIHVGDGGTSHVARAHQYYREHPRKLDLVVRQLADLVVYEAEPAKAEDLIVLVRPDSFRTGEDGAMDRGPVRPIAAGLVGIVAVDAPSSYRFAVNGELSQELDMDDAAIWDRAMANLRDRLKGASPPRQKPGHVTGVTTDIGLASSLLLLDEYWAHPDIVSLGELVVAPLERDELVIAPLNDPLMVKALRNIVSQRDNSQFLCDRLLLRRNGAWEEFE